MHADMIERLKITCCRAVEGSVTVATTGRSGRWMRKEALWLAKTTSTLP